MTAVKFHRFVSSVALCGVLCLSSCSTAPHRAKIALTGSTRAALVSCLGVPDQREAQDGQEVLTWKQDRAPASFSLTTPFSTSLSFSSAGNCHVTATVRNGLVSSLVYSGAAGGIEGPDAACRAVVRGCVPSQY